MRGGGLPGVGRRSIYDIRAQGKGPCPDGLELEEVPVSIAGAFDVHRRRLTLGYPGTVTGELRHGRVALADREHLRQWLTRFAGHGGEAGFALEGCTGWRCVVGELVAAGVGPHLAEPAGTAALRGRKRHARTGRTGTRHLRVHLLAGGLPGSWIPPEHVLEARAAARLYKRASHLGCCRFWRIRFARLGLIRRSAAC